MPAYLVASICSNMVALPARYLNHLERVKMGFVRYIEPPLANLIVPKGTVKDSGANVGS